MSLPFSGTDDYVSTPELDQAVSCALVLGRPLLVKGEPGTGKTLLAEAVSHVPAAALATVDAITVTSKLTAPALQRGEPHPEQQGQFTGPGTIGPALVEDLRCLPAIVRQRQSSPSSPQKA